MNNIVEQFIEVRKKLLQELNISDDYYIDFKLDTPWELQGTNDVLWVENNEEFGAEVRTIDVSDHHTALLIYNGCGDTFYTVFKNVERVDELPY